MGTIDAFQRQVWSPQFKQNCFPHRSKMGVLKSFPKEALQNPCSQVELNKIVPFGFSLQRQKMVFFLLSK